MRERGQTVLDSTTKTVLEYPMHDCETWAQSAEISPEGVERSLDRACSPRGRHKHPPPAPPGVVIRVTAGFGRFATEGLLELFRGVDTTSTY